MGRHIVAVDDSEIAREMVKATLADFGFDSVTTYPGPLEALADFTSGREAPDLFLLDIMMPEMDGIELCARLRAVPACRDVPILMLTSRTDKQALSKAFMAGANDYVSKPFDRIELQARITSLLRLRSEMDRRRAAVAEHRPGSRSHPAEPELPQGLMLGQAGLRRCLDALPGASLPSLGLIALRLDMLGADHADLDAGERRRATEALGLALARRPMPGADLLAHWDDDIFLIASLAEDGAALTDRARAMLDELPAALGADQALRRSGTPSLSAGVALPGSFGTLAAGLGDVLQALDRALQRGGNCLDHAGPPAQTDLRADR